jgi:hypothetical protein
MRLDRHAADLWHRHLAERRRPSPGALFTGAGLVADEVLRGIQVTAAAARGTSLFILQAGEV